MKTPRHQEEPRSDRMAMSLLGSFPMPLHPTAIRVLNQAIVLIEEHGEANLRIQDIQDAVGVTAPSIYHFFGSREGLVEAAHVERFSQSLHEFQEPIRAALERCSSRDDVRGALKALLAQAYDPARAPLRLRRLSALGATLGRPHLADRLAELSQEHHRVLAAALKPSQDQGWINRNLDLEVFMTWLSGLVVGRVYVEIGQSEGANPRWDAISERAIVALLFSDD
jgi:AcrR family transcriptional regulator